MLRSLRTLPLRRVIHTSSTRQTLRSRAGLVLGASAAVTGYVAWKSMTEQAIALDSVGSCEYHVSYERISMLKFISFHTH